jgi:hypothetical protein
MSCYLWDITILKVFGPGVYPPLVFSAVQTQGGFDFDVPDTW